MHIPGVRDTKKNVGINIANNDIFIKSKIINPLYNKM